MTTNTTVILFTIIFVIFGLVIYISIKNAVPPNNKVIDKYHKIKLLDYNKYFFFYQRGTAYRRLFEIHTAICTVFKSVGTISTFVTVYCVVDENAFVLLAALISAACETIMLMVPSEKYARIYVQAARIMESALNRKYKDSDDELVALEKAYEDAEKIIQNEFI